MEENEYVLYKGFRITFPITADSAQSFIDDKLCNLIEFLNPYLNTGLWRSTRPACHVDLPPPIQLDVIGL